MDESSPTTRQKALAINTVATRSHGHPGNGRGWLGVRFQSRPHEPPSSIIIHAHLFESTAARQQEALGIPGVNLIRGAFTQHAGMTSLIHTPDVLARIQREDPSWEAMVPATVAEMIKRKNLFAT